MPNVIDAGEYAVFVTALPTNLEASLISNETLSTAYFKARQMGWLASSLIGEAKRLNDGGGGIGSIVNRFRMLATTPPLARTESEQRPERVPYKAPIWEPTPFAWVQERVALLHRIGEGGFTPDAAENEMKALIAKQNASRDVDPFA